MSIDSDTTIQKDQKIELTNSLNIFPFKELYHHFLTSHSNM